MWSVSMEQGLTPLKVGEIVDGLDLKIQIQHTTL